MFRNYFKVALRNIKRYSGYSFINISGLTVGIVCCIFIFLYVRFEFSYDNYHKDADRIYRVALKWYAPNGTNYYATISIPAAVELKENFPQVEQVVRISNRGTQLVRYNDNTFYENWCFYAGPEIFDVFSIPIIVGDKKAVLNRPGTVLITRGMAEKYFAEKNPIGEFIQIGNVNFEITGIIADPPENTHLKYNFIASLLTEEIPQSEIDNWYNNNYHTYIKLAPRVNLKDFEELVSHMSDKYNLEYLKESKQTHTYFLQPLKEIHLHSNIRREFESSGNPLYLYILSVVAVLILVIAFMNFINLVTARSSKRAKEVGVRKVVGAQYIQLVFQFIGETFFLLIISVLAAFVLAGLFLPHFNTLASVKFTIGDLFQPYFLVVFTVLTLCAGLAAGSYPAFFLSAFQPVNTIKGLVRTGNRGFSMRKFLVIGQFTISIGMIICTVTIFRQIGYMKNQYPGFDREQKLIIPVRAGASMSNNYETVKNAFVSHHSITGAVVSSSVPGRYCMIGGIRLSEEASKDEHRIYLYSVDYDFISEYKIEIIAGRPFQRDRSTDYSGAIIINEAALKEFGMRSPGEALGRTTEFWGETREIIGIIKDFHFSGLQQKIEPFLLVIMPRYSYITLTVDRENIDRTIKFANSQWNEFFPGIPFEYFFLDEEFNRQYNSEVQIARMFSTFTLLGLFIACLGLLGLISFTAEMRTKEIGIRKVVGASKSNILVLLSKEYTRCILLANLIAWPAAYFAMNRWLRDFAYRITISTQTFILSAFLALIIAWIVVSYQALKAASANPAEALRFE